MRCYKSNLRNDLLPITLAKVNLREIFVPIQLIEHFNSIRHWLLVKHSYLVELCLVLCFELCSFVCCSCYYVLADGNCCIINLFLFEILLKQVGMVRFGFVLNLELVVINSNYFTYLVWPFPLQQ